MTTGDVDMFKHVPQEMQVSGWQAESRVLKIKCLVRLTEHKKGKYSMFYLTYLLTVISKWGARVVSNISWI